MKIWIKLLAGAIIGLILGIVLPDTNGNIQETLGYFADLIINFGRFALVPMLFFGVMIGTYELRQKKKTLRVYGTAAGLTLATTFIFVFIASITVQIIQPDGVRMGFRAAPIDDIPEAMIDLLQVIPDNLFSILTGPGGYILPIVFLAFFIGINLDFDRRITRPALELFDSLNRVFFHINHFIWEILAPGILLLTTYLVVNIKAIAQPGEYSQLFWILTIISFIILLIILPIAVFLILKKKNPYMWLFKHLSSFIAAFVSGDIYFTLGSIVNSSKQNGEAKRAEGSAAYSLAAIFARPGTAIVSIVTFILIIRSDISLQISFGDFIWIVGSSLMLSFALGSIPLLGVPATLAYLSKEYSNIGNNIGEDAYVMVMSIVPVLTIFAVLIDTAATCFIGAASSHLTKSVKE